MIQRQLQKNIAEHFFKGKAIIIFGARQVGKTTLVKELIKPFSSETLWLTADAPEVEQMLTRPSLARLQAIVGQHRIVVIDEAQRIPEIGLTLKLFTDQIPEVQVIATGSSALDLAAQTAEPLTGRKWEFQLFPISFAEMTAHSGLIQEHGSLAHRLVFGAYPEIITAKGNERTLLNLITSAYLYKDLFRYEQIKKPVLLEKIVRALALQVGSEVSFHEIGQLVGASPQTVEKYIDLLEKAFVIVQLPALSRNLRNEIKRGRKIYFLDNGIRNAILGNFSPLESRTDVGALWENFLISERLKYVHYNHLFVNRYFWRTTEQQEIDYLEEIDGQFYAYEFKYQPHKKVRFPNTFSANYPVVQTTVVSSENYDSLLLNY
ncbi:MAG: ATP-binding protein [Saprospiraceae bacterium]|nr:ATP-binding protein [Saprospiraceae bacterium]